MTEHLLQIDDLRVSFDTYAGEVQAVHRRRIRLRKKREHANDHAPASLASGPSERRQHPIPK